MNHRNHRGGLAVAEDAFDRCGGVLPGQIITMQLTGNNSDYPFSIVAVPGSYAEAYANESGYPLITENGAVSQ